MARRKDWITSKSNEHHEQVAFVRWCALVSIPVYAVPNAGRRSRSGGRWQVSEGLRAGVPDLCIPVRTED